MLESFKAAYLDELRLSRIYGCVRAFNAAEGRCVICKMATALKITVTVLSTPSKVAIGQARLGFIVHCYYCYSKHRYGPGIHVLTVHQYDSIVSTSEHYRPARYFKKWVRPAIN